MDDEGVRPQAEATWLTARADRFRNRVAGVIDARWRLQTFALILLAIGVAAGVLFVLWFMAGALF